MNIVALAGGVGGAKLADGLARSLTPESLTVVVNTGDDFEHWGLKICPDLDTVCYTLAGLANPATGWGRADETWEVYSNIVLLGGEDWFRLGDKDLAVHIERTRRLRAGRTLTQIVREFCTAWNLKVAILPMSDDPVPTMVDTLDYGELPFQEYFVQRRCEPRVTGFRFTGIENAKPSPGIEEAIERADAVLFPFHEMQRRPTKAGRNRSSLFRRSSVGKPSRALPRRCSPSWGSSRQHYQSQSITDQQ
jgi:LPPG:FO 2-phospho-L-lactate transferase